MDLFELLGKVSIDNADANKALDDTAKKGENTGSKLGKAFSVIGKGALAVGKVIGVGLGAGATAMGGLTIKAMNLAGELEQNMGGSEAVFKEFATKMQETAKGAFENMGLSTSEFLGTANKMGALFQGAGFSIEESSNLASDAMQRAADVASIMGIDTASAMEAISGAAKGNFDMMDNLGVAMNDTTLNAYALEKGIGKTTQEMTNQEKIALAMEMFMEKTAYAAGNYAKENETLAGSLGTAKAALTNFLDGSGDVDSLVSALSNTANVIVKNISEIAPRLVDGLIEIANQILPMLPGILEKLLPVIIEGATGLINGIVAILPDLVEMLTTSLIPQLITAFVSIINALVEALPDLIDAIVGALPTLIPMLIDALVSVIVTICSHFGEIIEPIIDHLPTIIESLNSALLKNLPVLIKGLIALALGVAKASAKIWGAVGKAFVDTFKDIWKNICEVFSNVGGFFKDAFKRAWENVKEVFSGVKSFFTGIWEDITTAFSEIGTKIADSISGAVKAGINGLIGSAEKIINGFFKMINGAIGIINKIPGVNITKIKMVEFTRLAKGGVVDEPTPAVFGEDGAEAVVPLENNTGWLNKIALKLHEFNMQLKGGLDGEMSIRSVELQQVQVTEMQNMNSTLTKILIAIVRMDENMGGNLREALDGMSLGINKREFARLVRGTI